MEPESYSLNCTEKGDIFTVTLRKNVTRRIARRDKKAFLSDQCNKIEENNRMGNTRDLLRKLEVQRNISCKDGLDKGQKWSGPNRSRRY